MSKGSKQRPGTGYTENWGRIFGKKEESCKHTRATYGDPWVCMDCGFEGSSPFNKSQAAPKLMTLSEAMKAGYSMEYVNCGPSVSGAVIRVAKWDDALNYFQYIDVRPDARDEAIAEAIQKYGTYPGKVWHKQPDGSLLPADGGAPLESIRPTRITGNFRCKVNGLDTLNDAGFEVLTQPGFDYVLEAIEPPAKTCQHCKHKDDSYCTHPKIEDITRRWGCIHDTKLPDDFGCVHWGAKA